MGFVDKQPSRTQGRSIFGIERRGQQLTDGIQKNKIW